MKKSLERLNKILFYGFLLFGIGLLFHGTGRISTPIIAFMSFFASVLCAFIFKEKKINEGYIFWINLFLWLNIAGELYLYYGTSFPLDKVLHIAFGLILTVILYDYYKKNSALPKDAVFFTVLGMLGLWEIYEYSVDTFFGFQTQGVFTNGVLVQTPLNDTMIDLILGAIGSVIYLIFKREKIQAVSKVRDKKKQARKERANFFLYFINYLKWR